MPNSYISPNHFLLNGILKNAYVNMPSFCLKFFLHLFNRITICLHLCICSGIIISSASSHSGKYPSLYHSHKGFPDLTSFSAFLSRPTPDYFLPCQLYSKYDKLSFAFSPPSILSPFFLPLDSHLLTIKNKNKTLGSIFHWATPTHPPSLSKNVTFQFSYYP